MNSRVSNRPDLGGTIPILTENPESRLKLSRDAKCPDFEKQRSCREVIDQKNSLNGIFSYFVINNEIVSAILPHISA